MKRASFQRGAKQLFQRRVGSLYVPTTTNGMERIGDVLVGIHVSIDPDSGYAVTANACTKNLGVLEFNKQDTQDIINGNFPQTITVTNKNIILVEENLWESQAQGRAKRLVRQQVENGILPSIETWRAAGYGDEEYNLLKLLLK